MKLITAGEIIYLLLFGIIVGKGILNYRTHSAYWPGSHGVVGVFGLLGELLVIAVFSLVVAFLLNGFKVRGISIERKQKFIATFSIAYLVISVPAHWIIPAII